MRRTITVTKIMAKPKPSPMLLAKYWMSFAIGSPRMFQTVPVVLPLESTLTQPDKVNNNDKLSPDMRRLFTCFFNSLFHKKYDTLLFYFFLGNFSIHLSS